MSHELLDYNTTVDGRNPAPVEVGSLFIMYKVLYILGGWPWDFRTINSMNIIPSTTHMVPLQVAGQFVCQPATRAAAGVWQAQGT